VATTARPPLSRLLWLSVAAAVATITLKTLAWDHPYGHEKADYLSAGVEGSLILLAALTIAYSATQRLLDPQPISDVGIGLSVSVAASAINLVVARKLMAAGREHRSLVLEADGRHLMTDVWTSVGVVAGVALVALTGWERLDPIIAMLVAANIVVTGVSLVHRFTDGLMDRALPPEPRNHLFRGADAVPRGGRPHRRQRYRELPADPARSENPCMRGVSMRENREVPRSPASLISGRAAQERPRPYA
jgi:cation diffusion facilitator family transporter